MNREEFVLKFLKQDVLGQKVDMNNPEEVLEKCIGLADKDMLTGGMYIIASFRIGKWKKSQRVESVLNIIKRDKYRYCRCSIKDIADGVIWKADTVKHNYNSYGLAQKLYNMSFKYAYVFKDELKDYNFDFSECDCPIDSTILKRLECQNEYKWTQLTSTEYVKLQGKIDEELKKEKYGENIGRMLFDVKWVNQ